jgi:hypothetical protein
MTFAHYLLMGGGKSTLQHQENEVIRIYPHPRTLRKAREHVKQMVSSGVSPRKITCYLHLWAVWWSKTSSNVWQYHEILIWFIKACWDIKTAIIAAVLLKRNLIEPNKHNVLIQVQDHFLVGSLLTEACQ